MGKYSKMIVNVDIETSYKTYSGFSFPAFFFTSLWFFTKGMYLHFIVYSLIFSSSIYAIIDIYLSNQKNFFINDWMLVLCIFLFQLYFHILAGLKANQWYKEYLFKLGYKIDKDDNSFIEQEDKSDLEKNDFSNMVYGGMILLMAIVSIIILINKHN
jgi:hypothetical protein